MKIVFRVDASNTMGTGHVMRCRTLAAELKKHGAHIQFITRAHPGHLGDMLKRDGFAVTLLPPTADIENKEDDDYAAWLGDDWTSDAEQTKISIEATLVDWLIVDHYAIDARWEQILRPFCRKLMVIDDLADRPHDCDLLLDQNFYHDEKQRYKGLIPAHCLTLLGPTYVLLRPEFAEAKQQFKGRDGTIKRILVFFGGSDPSNETGKVLAALQQLKRSQITVDVVVGSTNTNRIAIQKLCEELPSATYRCNVTNMAELILNADLGIGAGGSAMWERCYLGLPTITVVFAANQVRTTEDVADRGAIEYLGWSDSLTSRDYAHAISNAIVNSQRMKQISDAALSVLPKVSAIDVNIIKSLLQSNSDTFFK